MILNMVGGGTKTVKLTMMQHQGLYGLCTTTSIRNNVTAISRANSIPSGVTATDLTDYTSTAEAAVIALSDAETRYKFGAAVYGWYDSSTTTIYWYCPNDVCFNINCNYEMQGFYNADTYELPIITKATTNCYGMFYLFLYKYRSSTYPTSAKTLDLSDSDLSGVESAAYMFNYCGFTNIIFPTSTSFGKTTAMNDMFGSAARLGYFGNALDLSSFDTSNVTTMASMFKECRFVQSIVGLTSWSTPKLTDVESMFYDCMAITSIDLSSFDFSNVTVFTGMFRYCQNVTSITFPAASSSNISYPTEMDNTFAYCYYLQTVSLSCFSFENLESMTYMFSGDMRLTSVTHAGGEIKSENFDCSYAFSGCRALTSQDITSTIFRICNAKNMFYNCGAITSIDFSSYLAEPPVGINGANAFETMFQNCSALITLYAPSFPEYYIDTGGGEQRPIDSDDMFDGCTSIIGDGNFAYNSSYVDGTYARCGGSGYCTDPAFDTLFYIHVDNLERPEFTLYLKLNSTKTGDCYIDWGDNTTSNINTTSYLSYTHTYSAIGDFVVKLHNPQDVVDVGGGTSALTAFGTVTASTVGAYTNCMKCYKVILGSNISLAAYAFGGTNGLEEFNARVPFTNAANVFRANTTIKKVKLPNGLTSILGTEFHSCYNLVEITLPSSITSLGTGAFQNAYGLHALNVLAINPPSYNTSTNSLSGVDSTCEIYVPDGIASAYIAANGWKGRSSHIATFSNRA